MHEIYKEVHVEWERRRKKKRDHFQGLSTRAVGGGEGEEDLPEENVKKCLENLVGGKLDDYDILKAKWKCIEFLWYIK